MIEQIKDVGERVSKIVNMVLVPRNTRRPVETHHAVVGLRTDPDFVG